MRKLLLLAAGALVLPGCSDSTESSVPTSVVISPAVVALDAAGATQVVRASVADQNGKPMTGKRIAWSSTSASVTVVDAGGDSAVVTSLANGLATVAARAGDAVGAVQVQVRQVPTSVEKLAGDAQAGVAGAALALPLRVRVRDRLGAPVAGQPVAFGVVAGAGSVAAASVVTDADGTAATSWTLGTAAGGAHEAAASVAGLAPVRFAATAAAGAPASITALAGDSQSASAGAAVSTSPRVRVLDAYGNPVPGVPVSFAVASGGGSVTGGSQTTDAGGEAGAGSWTLGSTAGANTLSATIPGSTVPAALFTATATARALSLSIAAGGNQAAMAGAAVATPPSVMVRDQAGLPAAGVQVRFAVTAGGGSVSEPAATTDASGVASVARWVLGPAADLNTLTASVPGSGTPVVFRGAGCSGAGAAFEITVCITTAMTASQRAAFQSSAARWGTLIRGDVPNMAVQIPENACGDGTPSANQVYDDLFIFAAVADIDGPRGVLGQAGPCYLRGGTRGLPLVGVMEFDAADLGTLEANGQLGSVILHEMGHVLGIGTIWNRFGLLQSPSTSGSRLDTYYSGAGGIQGFNTIGGSSYTGGQKVPVENTGGAGTMNGHWRDSVLRNELMTGYIDAGSNPLSVLTVGSLADLGYTVDLAAADHFFLTLSLESGAASARPRLQLLNDLYTGPQYVIGARGSRVRIR